MKRAKRTAMQAEMTATQVDPGSPEKGTETVAAQPETPAKPTEEKLLLTWTRETTRYRKIKIHAPVNRFGNNKALKSPEVKRIMRASFGWKWDTSTSSHIKNIEDVEKLKEKEGVT